MPAKPNKGWMNLVNDALGDFDDSDNSDDDFKPNSYKNLAIEKKPSN